MVKYLVCLYMLTSVFSDYEFVRIRGRYATETSWLIEILRRLLCIRFHSDRRCRGGRWVWRIVHIYLSLFVTNCGLATDNMLQIIEAHPNWPVCADVFEHSSPRLASQRPIWSDITSVSVNTIMLWWEDWSSASVVNHIIVTDPTIWQPGFDLPCHTWSLMNRFRTGQLAHVMLTCTNGVSPSHLPMIVASNRPWTTLSTRAR